MRARHPRTAMGITRDRRTFILLSVDGRSTRSAGMYGTELARLMDLLGAWQAFNLDGGGSTTFWQRGPGVLNRPSDGAERPVANHWGIFAGSSNGRPRAAGSCYAVPVDAGVVDAAVDAPRLDVTAPRDATVVDVVTARDVGSDTAAPRDARPLDVLRDIGVDLGAEAGGDVVPALDVSANDVVDAPEPEEDDAGEAPPDFIDASRPEPPPEEDIAAPQPEGCSCRAGRSSAPGSAGGALVAALAALSRRRRRLSACCCGAVSCNTGCHI